MNDIDTDLVRFEHDECEDAELIHHLCDEIDSLRFQLVTIGMNA